MSAPGRRAAVLYNPIAGEGRAAGVAQQAVEQLRAEGWEAEALATQAAGGAEPLAREHAPHVDRLVVAGGDGSIREAVSGLVAAGYGARVAVAILPCGNANVVARELGVPLDPAGALPHVTASTTQPVDLGFANGELFLAVAGVGWDARTVRRLSRIRAGRLGGFFYRLWADSVYLLAGVMAAFSGLGNSFQLTVDGAPAARGYPALVVANLRCYGKGWTMTPDASPASGRLHYHARKARGPLFILWQLLDAMLQRRVPAFVSDYGAGQQIAITASKPFAFQVDGDDRGDTRELRLEAHPAGAVFVVPADESGT